MDLIDRICLEYGSSRRNGWPIIIRAKLFEEGVALAADFRIAAAGRSAMLGAALRMSRRCSSKQPGGEAPKPPEIDPGI